MHYFRKNTVKRLATSIVHLADTSLDAMMHKFDARQRNVDLEAQVVDAQRQELTLIGIGQISSQLNAYTFQKDLGPASNNLASVDRDSQKPIDHLLQLTNDMNAPISRIADELELLQDTLTEAERLKIFRWLSTAPYSQHHQNVRKGRLHQSGRWLFEHLELQRWASTSYSSILWIHGIPGSGKSKLVSLAIDKILAEDTKDAPKAPVAYFYCARDNAEPERAIPEKILLSIAIQLSGTEMTKPLPEATILKHSQLRHEGIEARSLSMDETVQLILNLTFSNPATIFIDGLDECDPARRHELLDSFDDIVQKSANVVKILISSRDDGDIQCRLKCSPNLDISAEHKSGDIDRFVEHEVFSARKDY